MNTAVLSGRKEKEDHAVAPGKEVAKSTPLGWFVLLILGTATVFHIALAEILGFVNHLIGH